MLLFSQLAHLTKGTVLQLATDRAVSHLLTDSRKPILHDGSVFIAIAGERHDGHAFIQSLYQQGIRQFIVSRQVDFAQLPEANI